MIKVLQSADLIMPRYRMRYSLTIVKAPVMPSSDSVITIPHPKTCTV